MQYLLLIYSDETGWGRVSEAEQLRWIGEYQAFTEGIQSSGQYKAGQRLEPTTKARTVRVRDGKTLTTDGPFAETAEQLGGFFWVEAKDDAEAAAIAARCPAARHGTVEVRPIYVTG